MSVASTDDTSALVDDARRAVRLAAVLVLLVATAGAIAIYVVAQGELWRNSVFFGQFAVIEWPGLVIVTLFAIAVLALLRRSNTAPDLLEPAVPWLADSTLTRLVIALGVLAITVVGAHLVFHDYLLYDDEYSAWFQALIYSRGERVGTIPSEWCRWITSLAPIGVEVAAPCSWRIDYLPVHSLIRGAFLVIGGDRFAEPVLAASSVVLAMLIARRAWPDRPSRAVLTGIFLGASTQFLVMSMTGFSMTSHLFLSLVWLWLYVSSRWWAWILLPWVGVLALGLHSPIPHVLFVAPFLLSFLIQRRFALTAYLATVYSVGLLFWTGKYHSTAGVVAGLPVATPAEVGGEALHYLKHTMGGGLAGGEGLSAAMSMVLLTTWSVPIGILCVLVALLLWKRLDGFSRWLALSALCTIGGRAIFFGVQGGGWGNRYAFAVLGNLVMLAAIGTEFMVEALGRRRTYALLAGSLVTALAVQLPLRGLQVERIVGPYARASRWLESYPADIVVLLPHLARWDRRLIRNDPFLRNTPKLVSAVDLKPGELDSLLAAHRGRVKLVTRHELVAFGIDRIHRVVGFEIQQ